MSPTYRKVLNEAKSIKLWSLSLNNGLQVTEFEHLIFTGNPIFVALCRTKLELVNNNMSTSA